MRRRHTRRTDPALAGATVQRAVRFPEVQVEAVQKALAQNYPDLHSFADAVVDAMWLWLYEDKRSNGWTMPAEPPPEPPGPEPEERPYTGDHERPTWSDVDPSTLDA